MSAVARYEAARAALAEAHAIDEVKDVLNEAAAWQEYARQAKDPELIQWATDIRLRAKRELGVRMARQKAAGLMARGANSAGLFKNPAGEIPITLAEAGIDKNLANGARRLAAMDDETFEKHVAVAKKKMAAAVESGSGDSPMPGFTGDFEWYTPREIIELAVETMGGIDFDPASCADANKVVGATTFYSKMTTA